MTVYEKLQKMSVKEIAEVLFRLDEAGKGFCRETEACQRALEENGDIPENMCFDCVVQWLNSEAEEVQR